MSSFRRGKKKKVSPSSRLLSEICDNKIESASMTHHLSLPEVAMGNSGIDGIKKERRMHTWLYLAATDSMNEL